MGADMRVLAEMAGAWLRTHWNEVSIDEKSSAHDPVKLRLGGWVPEGANGYLGAISFDLLAGDSDNPLRYEKVMLAFKLDPDPTLDVYMMRRRDNTEDRDMLRVLRLTPQELEMGVPIRGMATGGPQSGVQSPNGRYRFQIQDDANVVIVDYGVDPPRPLWATGTNQ